MTTPESHLLRQHAKSAALWADEIRVEASATYPCMDDLRECVRELESRVLLLKSLLGGDVHTKEAVPSRPLEEFTHGC